MCRRCLSLENIINIVQQTALSVRAHVRTNYRVAHAGTGRPVARTERVDDQRRERPDNEAAVVGSDGSNGIIAALAGTASGLLIGLLVGLFNGIAVAWLRVNPFVATLASMNICLGIGTSLSDGHPVFGIPEGIQRSRDIGCTYWEYRCRRHTIAVAVGIALHLLLQYTIVGRSFYVLGSNPRAAIGAGWPRRRLLALAYVLSALLTAVGALILTARAASSARLKPWAAGSLCRRSRLRWSAASSLTGGRGGLSSALIWLVLHYYSVKRNELGGNRQRYTQMLVMGAIVIFAVALDRVARVDV